MKGVQDERERIDQRGGCSAVGVAGQSERDGSVKRYHVFDYRSVLHDMLERERRAGGNYRVPGSWAGCLIEEEEHNNV